MMTKAEIMAKVREGVAHECFDHQYQGTYDVTATREYIAKLPSAAREEILFLVELEQLRYHLENERVFEQARVDEFKGRPFAEVDPLVALTYDDGSQLLIDGAHRAMAGLQQGHKYCPCYILHESLGVRPDMSVWGRNPEHEWGDDVVDGKIVKRTKEPI